MKTDTPSARRRQAALIAAILVIFAGTPAHPQTLTTGALSGTLTSTSGEPLPNVLLTLRDTSAGTLVSLTAARDGRFRFAALSPAVYVLTAERIGYAPLRILHVDVRPERELSLQVQLRLVETPAEEAEERMAPAPVSAIGASEWVPQFALRHLPGRSHTLREARRFSSRTSHGFATEGLPAWLSTVAVDGTPFRAVGLSAGERGAARVEFPDGGFQAAQILANPLDTEWTGTAASLLSAYSLRGAADVRGEVEGQWSGDVLSISTLEGGDVTYADVRGSALLRGPLTGNGARYSLGIDARREQVPVSSAWLDTDAVLQLVAANPALDTYRRAAAPTTTALGGFARIDWPLSQRHQLELTVHAASLPAQDVIAPSGAIPEQDGLDLIVSAGVLSQLGDAVHNELRTSITSSERAAVENAAALPVATFADEALALGVGPAWASARDAHVSVSDALHYTAGGHALKIGGAVTLSGYRYEAAEQIPGEYSFGGVDEFLAGTGVLVRTEGTGPAPDWTDRTLALFAQDRFTIGRDVEVMAGVRAERQTLPASVARDDQWEQLTGIANDEVAAPGIRLSPRASAIWNVGGSGRWVLSASGGIYYDRLDPLILAEWQHSDGSLSARRIAGAVAWPTGGESVGVVGTRLTLLGSGFEAPRTLRAAGGLSASLLEGTTLSLSGVVRRTENLPRRTDLNLVTLPAAQDQHGRDVFGTLVKQGGLVAAEPGSNRLFTTYDEVAGIITDRTSEHWGVSFALDHALSAGFGIVARYTFGRTTDDWFAARYGGWSVAAPHGLGTDSTWSDGTSDFDVPHRATAGVLWSAPAGIRLGAAYRVQSGRPFTPGFRAGVDANGDGVAGNDPAFIDESAAGMDALMSSWPCLRESAGGFAHRNACRTDVVHALDINVAVPLIRFGGGVASARIDVFDALESSQDVPDTALYLIDPAAVLVSDPVARTVRLPLVTNENFGEPLANRHSGRIVRVGLSINW